MTELVREQVLERELAKIKPTTKRTQQIAFVFAFLALLVDGADMLLLSFSLNSLKAEFGLSNLQAGTLGSFTLAGMAIGGFIGGWACDRLGRVRTVVISILIFSVLTAALGFTQNYEQFAVLRFLSAFGIGSLYIAASTLMAEYVPTKYRTTILGTLQAGWTVGYIVATVLAGWIIPEYGWRTLFLSRLSHPSWRFLSRNWFLNQNRGSVQDYCVYMHPLKKPPNNLLRKVPLKKSLQILRIVKCLFYGFLRLGSCSLAITV